MLLIGDPHFSDIPRDSYRWGLWIFLLNYCKTSGENNVIFLGDLTVNKDRHSAVLVNKIVLGINILRSENINVYILKGNHDYIDPKIPFFRFLSSLPNVRFFVDPVLVDIEKEACLFLPHTRDTKKAWDKKVKKKMREADLIFMHQSIIGSVASNGYEMTEGLKSSYFNSFEARVFSGDIHVPQRIGNVEYVGAPYTINFNDNFDPHCLVLNGKQKRAIKYPCLRRYTFDIVNARELEDTVADFGSQVKIRLRLPAHHRGKWAEERDRVIEICKERDWELCSFSYTTEQKLPKRGKEKRISHKTDKEIVDHYGKRKGVDHKTLSVGRRIVQE